MAIDPGIIEIVEAPAADIIELVDGEADIIELVDAGITPGPQGLPGASAEQVPESVVINRVDGEITSLDYAGGKTVTINRAGGEIESISDGIYLKTITRFAGEVTGIVVTEI